MSKDVFAAARATTHAYVGSLACGCGVAIVSDMPGFEKDTARDVADFIRRGYAVQRLSRDDAVSAFSKKCDRYPHEAWQERNAKQQALL